MASPSFSSSPATFPPDFTWGVATASYQIEGGHDADGKGPSVWDAFCQTPGKIHEGHRGDVACDHYHRLEEDVALMKALGVRAYRLSFSWPRLMPEGEGKVNAAGLAFYDRLVNALLAAGIEPWVTLFHWDYPLALQRRGGWLNPRSPDWFAAYARVVVDHFSDRVKNWMTLNEPQCFIGLGLEVGYHAPGLKLALPEILLAGHHALLAHGRAVRVIREHGKQAATIGWAPVGVVAMPHDETSPADIEAARAATFAIPDVNWCRLWNNTLWGDPVVLGRYPDEAHRSFGSALPRATAEELAVISSPIDFYGANIYNGQTYRAGPDGAPEKTDADAPGFPQSLYNWKRKERSLYWGPRYLHERYKLPVVITENGVSCHDWVDLDGEARDPQRIDFTRRYLRELRRAIADGVDVRGYFHWSFMDNFEWQEGYKQRFGLVHVDYGTLRRTPKSSYHWYARVIAANGSSDLV
jgi:beta-glucosidase